MATARVQVYNNVICGFRCITMATARVQEHYNGNCGVRNITMATAGSGT